MSAMRRRHSPGMRRIRLITLLLILLSLAMAATPHLASQASKTFQQYLRFCAQRIGFMDLTTHAHKVKFRLPISLDFVYPEARFLINRRSGSDLVVARAEVLTTEITSLLPLVLKLSGKKLQIKLPDYYLRTDEGRVLQNLQLTEGRFSLEHRIDPSELATTVRQLMQEIDRLRKHGVTELSADFSGTLRLVSEHGSSKLKLTLIEDGHSERLTAADEDITEALRRNFTTTPSAEMVRTFALNPYTLFSEK